VITTEGFYELISMGDGRVGARMGIGELADNFAKCKRAGLDPTLPRLVPQNPDPNPGEHEAEDVNVWELAHLFWMFEEDPQSSGAQALQKILEVRDSCCDVEYCRETCLTTIGLDPEHFVGYNIFVALVGALTWTMKIDEDHLLSALYWAQTGQFEMTQTMAEEVMKRLFLKVADKGESVLSMPIKGNDFMRMCQVQKLSDNSGKCGIPHAQLSLFFQSTLHSLPRLLEDRDRIRGTLKKKSKEKKHHRHHSISGRVKLGVLFNELFKAMPGGFYRGPMHFVLSLLEVADASAVK